MANTLGGINLARIAQQTLDYLEKTFPPLMAVTRDFSDAIKERGESVTTRVVSSVTAVDVSSGYTAQDVTSTEVKTTLDKNFGFPYGFLDGEIFKAAYDFDWLKRIFIVPAVESVFAKCYSDLFALVTAANFTSNVTKTASAFDADVVADASGTLSTNKVPKTERSMILKPTYTSALQKDSVLQDASAYGGTEAVRDGVLGKLHGFQPYETTEVPANAESLEGMFMHPSSLVIAARQQIVPENFTGQIENVVDPVTGLPLQFRQWYDHNNKKTMVSVEALYGVAKGNGAALVRIKSA